MGYLKKALNNIIYIIGFFLVTKFVATITYNLTHEILAYLGLINPYHFLVNIQITWRHYLHDLMTGIREEVIFRYACYDIVLRKIINFSLWPALILSSFIFGIAHFHNLAMGEPYHNALPQVIMAGILGLWFGYAYIRKGLWLAILTHAIYNNSILWNRDIQAICIMLGAILSSILLVNYILKKLRYKFIFKLEKSKKPYTRYNRRLKNGSRNI